MFGYNENKQAYIADLKAGTYAQMVQAAESCQVSVIHPGKPWNPAEPGLAELIERAKPFLRRQIGAHIRLRRVPELIFHFDEGIAHQARVEELIIEIQKERELHPYQESTPAETTGTAAPTDAAKAEIGRAHV